MPTTLSQAQTLLRQAQKKYKKVKLHAIQLRDQHLEERLGLAHLQGDTKKAKAIATIKRVEAIQAMYRKIRHINKNKHTRHFSHLIVTSNGQDEVITTTTDIFDQLISVSYTHLTLPTIA